MSYFEQGQTNMSQDFKRGVVQNIEKGPTKQGKFGPVCTYKLTIDGKKYNLPFQDPNLVPFFNRGDTVQFMYEIKTFTNDKGEDISYTEIDKKTFGVADMQQTAHQDAGPPEEYYQQAPRQAPVEAKQPSYPAPKSEPDRQALIVAQSSLERAIELLTHNNPGTKITEAHVVNQMKRFANEIFNYIPGEFVEDAIPF